MRRSALAIAVTACLLSGCGTQSMLSPGGPASQNLADLGWFVFLLFSTVTAVMLGLIIWVAIRRRGTLDQHEPVNVGGGQNWILIGGFTIPFVVLALVFVIGLRAMSKFPLHDHAAHTPPEIRVTGHQWWWQVEYLRDPVNERFTTANEIHIPVGHPVDIDLASVDVIHSFFVPRLHGKVDLVPGQVNRIRVQASAPGVYRGQCAEYCGEQHSHMILLVVADPPDQYGKWYAGQLSDTAAPETEQQARGRELFFSRPCATCHTLRGTPAGGRLGPDLTHIGGRQRIAANSYINDDANLAAWVTHAQSLKPHVAMPNITQFTGQELNDVVAYLRHLK